MPWRIHCPATDDVFADAETDPDAQPDDGSVVYDCEHCNVAHQVLHAGPLPVYLGDVALEEAGA